SSGMRPNLYVGFMQVSWRNGRQAGVSSLVHPRAHFVDAKGERLRMEVYARLRRHWRFINELELFKDVQNQKVYSVNVYARASSVDYISAVGLYHPQVVEGSLKHDGSGVEPGFRNSSGGWNLNPHRRRIIRVTPQVLQVWHSLVEEGDPKIRVRGTREVASVNAASAIVLESLIDAPYMGGMS